MTDLDIKIKAEPSKDLDRCTFTVDRDVYPESSYHFGSPEAAKRSPLAERIFTIPGVSSVLISNNVVTVVARGIADWRPSGREIGGMIRQALASGQPAVDPALKAALPPAHEIKARVQTILDREVNPAVANHGGYIDLLDVKDNTIFIRMGGGCQGCGSANATLKQGVEQLVRQHVPEVGDILDTTDHAAGRNPYYAARHDH
jgi:NFU1 iron-sulfur cluster scaffold homolog, mitochondrial